MTDEFPDPPAGRGMPTGRLQARRAHLEREIDRLPRRGRRRLVLAVPLAALAVSGAAFAAGLFDKPLSQPDRVECHERPDLESRHGAARIGDAPDLRSPRALCAPLYERGYLADEGSRPQLTACYDRGIVRVFPDGPTVCARLGLEPLADQEYEFARDRIARSLDIAEVALATEQGASVTMGPDGPTHIHYEDTRCVPIGRAAQAVRAALHADGMDDFVVRADPRLAPEDCATMTGLPERFDGRTIELEGAGTDIYSGLDRTPRQIKAEIEARQRYEARVCDHPLGERDSRHVQDVRDALVCRAQRHQGDDREANCFTAEELRGFARRVLDNIGLSDWNLQVAGGPPPGSEYRLGYLAPPIIDERIRQVRLELSRHCLDYGRTAP